MVFQAGFWLTIYVVYYNQAILDYYAHRWTIEVLFRSHKRYMGLKSFMVRAAKAIDRLLLILSVAHFFFPFGLGAVRHFHVGLRLCRVASSNFEFAHL